jgi:antitoxin PrlF
METGILSSKGQITIPQKIRKFLNIKASDKLAFIPLEEGKVLITTEQSSATAIFGLLKHHKSKPPVSLEEMETTIQKRRLGNLTGSTTTSQSTDPSPEEQ